MNKFRIIVYCPEADIDKLINAMAAAGAGVLGKYTHNVFITKGEGNWFSEAGSNPTIGERGKMSREIEYKLETFCPKTVLGDVVKAIRSAHSYETPNIVITELLDPDSL